MLWIYGSDEADIAYPYEQDEYEETDAAVTRGRPLSQFIDYYVESEILIPLFC